MAVPAQPWASLERLWLPRLPHGKRSQVRRLRRAADRNATLLGVALVELAFGSVGVPFDVALLEFPRGGKPRLPGGPDFSISHAHGLVACALATSGRIGLDLEPIDAVRAATVARVLTADEIGTIEGGRMTPTDAWVMKEAVVKALGHGIGSLQQVRLHGLRATLGGEVLWLQQVQMIPGYVAWLARDRRSATVEVRRLELGDLTALPPAE